MFEDNGCNFEKYGGGESPVVRRPYPEGEVKLTADCQGAGRGNPAHRNPIDGPGKGDGWSREKKR